MGTMRCGWIVVFKLSEDRAAFLVNSRMASLGFRRYKNHTRTHSMIPTFRALAEKFMTKDATLRVLGLIMATGKAGLRRRNLEVTLLSSL